MFVCFFATSRDYQRSSERLLGHGERVERAGSAPQKGRGGGEHAPTGALNGLKTFYYLRHRPCSRLTCCTDARLLMINSWISWKSWFTAVTPCTPMRCSLSCRTLHLPPNSLS